MTDPGRADASLAPFAAHESQSRGRRHRETLPENTAPFALDRQRILSSTAFRRLLHKTQVFVTDCGDHFRTRLTHTLEVAAGARRLARRLGLNEDLAEAVALAHDLGHAPFGHAGESALAELMRDHGGFEHNLQSLRVVDYIEHPYPAFRGLNLSFEVRESLIKHRTRYDRPDASLEAAPECRHLLETGPQPPLEGQVVSVADAIAYTLHDTEDGVMEGFLTPEALGRCALWREAAAAVGRADSGDALRAVRRPIIDRLASTLFDDVVAESARRIDAASVGSVEEVRKQPDMLVTFSAAARAGLEELQALLARCVYRNHRVIRMDAKARRLVGELFQAYSAEPGLLPTRYAGRIESQGLHRVICDYIAGMTDRFCQEEHRRLFAPFHFG